MNKFVLVAIAGALSTSTAFAADLIIPTSNQAQPSYHAGFDWTGFYAGANLGYGWAEAEALGVTADETGSGILGGVQVGYNHDFGGFVLGAETDFQFSDINYEEDLGAGVTGRTAIDSFGTVRARAGLAADRFLPYVTAGLAYANASVSATGGGATVEVDDNYVGWTVGAGVEYAVTDNVSVKGEYLYLDLGEADFGTGIDVGLTSHVARVGLNYKF